MGCISVSKFISYSRNEPARTILWSVSLGTGLLLIAFMVLGGLGSLLAGLAGVVLCGWGVWSTQVSNVRHMALSSFWLFNAYWGTAMVLAVVSHAVLAAPVAVTSLVLATVYIYLSHQWKGGTHE